MRVSLFLRYANVWCSTPASTFPVGEVTVNDPSKVTSEFLRFGIQSQLCHCLIEAIA
jgi:hypothetical protein